MLYSNSPRAHYRKHQLAEVICQLRFPDILTIGAKEPADFQDAIRGMFPRYAARQEQPAPKLVNPGTPNQHLEPAAPITNYNFVSADGKWKLNLTKNFISLSTVAYAGWEDFGKRFDLPLAQFIRLYQPAYFERIGLRYVNIFSRKRLGLEDAEWTELIAPSYVGPLDNGDVEEEDFLNCACDFTLKLDSSCMAKIHAGPGRLKVNVPNAPQDTEVKFILDMDLSMSGDTPCTLAAGAMETLHGHATRIFEGALEDKLRDAMLGL